MFVKNWTPWKKCTSRCLRRKQPNVSKRSQEEEIVFLFWDLSCLSTFSFEDVWFHPKTIYLLSTDLFADIIKNETSNTLCLFMLLQQQQQQQNKMFFLSFGEWQCGLLYVFFRTNEYHHATLWFKKTCSCKPFLSPQHYPHRLFFSRQCGVKKRTKLQFL